MKTLTAKLRGFTLIELLIVITIIGILIVALLPRITGAPAKARDTARKSSLNQIATALESYMSDNNKYPGTAGNANCLAAADTDLASYLGGAVPLDPNAAATTDACGKSCTGGQFVYALSADTVHYNVVAKMEKAGTGNIEKAKVDTGGKCILQLIAETTGTRDYYFVGN